MKQAEFTLFPVEPVAPAPVLVEAITVVEALAEVESLPAIALDYAKNLVLPGENATPKEISFAIIESVFDSAINMTDCGVLINSSTGKDSTLMTALVVEVMQNRVAAGKPVVPVMIGISDTRSEFPEVAQRMRDEKTSITDFATANNLPITVELVGPKAERSLLVEIVGNGLALPQLKNSSAAMVGASWCMDRVKKTPLGEVVEIARNRFTHVIQMIGTRKGESVRRGITMTKYMDGMPFGLTKLSDNSGTITGCVPVVHWTDRDLKDWMTTDLIPYDFMSADNLRTIYSKGSKTDELAGECSITVTKDGGVTSVCSDLSGTRFGCWMCLLSTNKSLKNTSRKDTRYAWLRKFHNYLFRHHNSGDVRRKLRDTLGFTPATLFPKGFLIRERAFMLMLLFRAEIESGFTLLDDGQLNAIQAAWNRQGFADLNVDNIRKAAALWKKTGKPALGWSSDDDDFAIELTETIAGGVIGQQAVENDRANLLNMVAAFGASNPFYPRLTAWVFADPEDHARQTVMVADSVNVLGGKTNGLIMGNWVCLGRRQPLEWEADVAGGCSASNLLSKNVRNTRSGKAPKDKAANPFAGRSFFYMLNREDYKARVDKGHNPANDPVLQAYYANQTVRDQGTTAYECPLASGLMQQHQACSAKMDEPTFRNLFLAVSNATGMSDFIEDKEKGVRTKFDRAADEGGLRAYGKIEKHGTKTDPDVLKAGAKLRKIIRPLIEDIGNDYLSMRQMIGVILNMLKETGANCALVARMAYIVRTSWYDEKYAEAMLDQLVRTVVPGAKQVQEAA